MGKTPNTPVEGVHYETSFYSRFTERCTMVGDAIDCVTEQPGLDSYDAYPEMIRVPYDYCLK